MVFDKTSTSAWTFELSLLSIWNHASRPDLQIPLNLLVPPSTGTTPVSVAFGKNGVPGVTVRSLNRTFLNFGVGRELYLWGAAGCGGPNWRVGFDGGFRWGSESAEFNEIRHRSDTIAGAWTALHTDLEIPCGTCTFLAGFRTEWDYTWTDILQEQNDADVMGVNFLFNFGVRF